MYETDGIIQNVALSYTVGNFDPRIEDGGNISLFYINICSY